ncbi:abortive infection family protein [Frankia sp. CiP3]|uniref:abortive infection family protein n=1 Tax=Frankia sp. CiP3 TaxID=2880971 RepID=UPI0035B2B47F
MSAPVRPSEPARQGACPTRRCAGKWGRSRRRGRDESRRRRRAGTGRARSRRTGGTGHGPTATRAGLGARHAHLAVNAALTWCQIVLDTLADPNAPWHKNH